MEALWLWVLQFISAPDDVTKKLSLSMPLPAINRAKLEQAELAELEKAEKRACQLGVGVTEEAQRVFDALVKTYPCAWEGRTIVVLDSVRVSEPYRADNCVAPADAAAALDRISRVVRAANPFGFASVFRGCAGLAFVFRGCAGLAFVFRGCVGFAFVFRGCAGLAFLFVLAWHSRSWLCWLGIRVRSCAGLAFVFPGCAGFAFVFRGCFWCESSSSRHHVWGLWRAAE
jgi:hypothetical protein